jgi:hypothetical protein
MGVILGSKARDNVWKNAADWLATRSSGQQVMVPVKASRKPRAPAANAVPLRKAKTTPVEAEKAAARPAAAAKVKPVDTKVPGRKRSGAQRKLPDADAK